MTPLTNLLVESREIAEDYRFLFSDEASFIGFSKRLEDSHRKAYLLGQSEEKERILSCGHAHELVHGFQAYGLMAESKERAIFEDGFRDGRAMLMIDVLSKRDPRKTKEALDSAIGEIDE